MCCIYEYDLQGGEGGGVEILSSIEKIEGPRQLFRGVDGTPCLLKLYFHLLGMFKSSFKEHPYYI